MDHKLPDKYGHQIEGRTEKGNPNPTTHLKAEIAEIDSAQVQGQSQQATPPHFSIELADRSQQTALPLDSGVEQALPQCGTLFRSLHPVAVPSRPNR